MNWLDCFENPALAAKIYTKPFPLVDITVVDDNEIMSHRRMAALTLLMSISVSGYADVSGLTGQSTGTSEMKSRLQFFSTICSQRRTCNSLNFCELAQRLLH